MEIISKVGSHEYEFECFKDINLDAYSNLDSDKKIFFGLSWIFDKNSDTQLKSYRQGKKIFLNIATPCELFENYFNKLLKAQNSFDYIYNSCPYSSEFINKSLSNNKFKFCPIPNFTKDFFSDYNNVQISDKNYDVAFIGGIHSAEHKKMLKIIKNFNHYFISYQKRSVKNLFTWPFFINFMGFKSNVEKWKLMSRTKILIGTNLLYLKEHQIYNFKKIPDIESYTGYEHIINDKIAPQMKSRMIEAASTKTLMLIKHDNWNVIENWFKPNEHFIYWYDYKDLENKIDEISKNFSKYWHIIENAKNHVHNYYFENFIKKVDIET